MDNPKAIYEDLVRRGASPKDAAKMAQERTGLSVVSGRPINRKLKFTKESTYNGQYRLDT